MSNIGVNKEILLGNAGQDAEKKSLSGGKSVANFSIAINQRFRQKRRQPTCRMGALRCLG